jgi:hypothetical protein
VEHAGPVDATTLELLACTATIRAALLAPNGALLDLGRSQRLASPAQKTALLARDGGCVIPGVRREALVDRVEVRDLRLRPVAAGR